MSWFLLEDIKEREKIIGIWLRSNPDINSDVHKAIKKSKNLRFSEYTDRIIIHELKDDGQVLLEIWGKSSLDFIRKKRRYNVFYILVKQNIKWVCEGDLGTGFII
jgi:hypothetical protein